MIGKEVITYSIRNVFRKKTRSLLTIISIFIGIATIFIFVSFGLGLYNYVEGIVGSSAADKVIVQAKGIGAPGLDETFRLEEKDLRAVRKSRGVIEASGAYFKVADVSFRKEKKFAFVVGFDPKKPLLFETMGLELEDGRLLKGTDSRKVILGHNYRVADKIFSQPIKLNDKLEIRGVEVRVVGFLKSVGNPQDDSNIYINEKDISKIFPDKNNSYGWIVARVEPKEIDASIESIERRLRDVREQKKGEEDFFVKSFDELVSSYFKVLNIIVGFVILIALISVFVSAVNTANTMVTSVIERIREIGTIKAVGAKNSYVFWIFLFESGFLGLIGGILGVLVGFVISKSAGSLLKSLGWGFLFPSFPPSLFFGCIVFAVFTGAISGVMPAIRASRINVAEALRYE
ncbi:ABC transporter permease [Candidatus Pacearchaeota archaeon]|nr:MAG: ABC transporter permease [Candidatus Pacearchaeota archaeon]